MIDTQERDLKKKFEEATHVARQVANGLSGINYNCHSNIGLIIILIDHVRSNLKYILDAQGKDLIADDPY